MYSRNRIGVILPAQDGTPINDDFISSIPPYVDHIYIVSNDSSSDVVDLSMAVSGSSRISILRSKEKTNGDFLLTPAFVRAVEDKMDVVAVMGGTGVNEARYIPSLIDPIVWGRADLTKVRSMASQGAGVMTDGATTDVQQVIPVSETKITSNYRQLIEALQKNIAISRPVLEVIRDSSENDPEKRILLAIPCFNEYLTIGSLVLRAQSCVNEILVVNDGSTDDTVAIAQRAGAKVLSHPKNLGYGAALNSCFEYARQNDFDVLIIMDGDGQHDPRYIPDFIRALTKKKADIIIGSRSNGQTSGIPLYRRFGMKVLDRFTSLASNTEIHDSQSGFRAYGRKAIEGIRIQNHGMSAGSEILSYVQDQKLKVQEIPIQVRYDIPNTSSMNPLSHGLEVLGNVINLIGYERPMLTFGISGGVATLFGLITGFYAFSIYHTTNRLPYGPSFISGILLVLGILLIVSGLILNTLVQILKRQKIVKA
jgi:glycosyltransferase involved in cell wall biosynthesis